MDGIGSTLGVSVAGLEARFLQRDAVVAVIGLGYVGLPVARAIGERGFRVLGFDIDPAKVAMLATGQSYIRHIPGAAFAALAAAGRFEPTVVPPSRLSGLDGSKARHGRDMQRIPSV